MEEMNITLNPDKCRLGLSSVEYLGHVLDHDGITFSAQKINKVIDLPKLMIARDLKQFLGLVNYFHKHLRDVASIAKPLHQMITPYKKNSVKPLVWTYESDKAYDNLMEQMRNLPKLYYLIDKAPIFLYTDASQVGLGGYLYQMVNNDERPISFVSKAFTGAEVRWHTVEKESYAIHYCLQQLKHIIGNKPFTLRTDHRNLTFIKEGGSPKVLSWRLAITPFDFVIEYVPGINNTVADAFSRLCVMREYNIEIKVPDNIYKLISSCHNSEVGHMGFDITFERVTTLSDDVHLRAYVKKFISECPICQSYPIERSTTPQSVTLLLQ
jgi:hypothetical protein